MTSLAQLLHYTSLSQALFSKPLSPIGPAQPSRGECDLENSPLNLPRWTPCLFIYLFIFVCFLSYYPMLSTFYYCLYLETAGLLISSVVFIFVIFVCYFDYCPTPPPPSLSATAAACVWLSSVQVATAYRWDIFHTWDARRTVNPFVSVFCLLLQLKWRASLAVTVSPNDWA